MARKNQERRTQKTKPIEIGLMTADSAILYYFNEVIRPVVDNGDTLENVPVLYANPERWASIQKGQFVRDKKGQAVLPIITYKRTSVEKNIVGTKVDVTNPLVQSHQMTWNKRNRYDNFAALNGVKPSREMHNIVIPDYVKLGYECAIMTDYIEHLNPIIENINYAGGQYWGTSTAKFYASLDAFAVDHTVEDGADRAAKATFSLTLNGYIVPQNVQKEMSNFKPVSYTARQVKVQEQTTIQTDIDAVGPQDVEDQSSQAT